MKYAKLFSIVVAAGMGLYGLVGFYFLPLASFEGDLTRMAKLPESYFGWTKEQPRINPALMKSAGWPEADVLAIGDSFTMAQVWQTVLEQRGVHVRTETWESIFNFCEDFPDWLYRTGYKGKFIIIESVDKYLDERLSRSVKCAHMRYHPLAELPVEPPPTALDRNRRNFNGRLSVGIETELNTLKYERISSDPAFRAWNELGEVRMERMVNGCELFSHPRCQDVLFYDKDRIEDPGENVLRNMAEINARLKKFHVIWAIIPDKSIVYLHPDKQFWDTAERRFHAPNLLRILREEIKKKTVDLYLPNNTHFSTTGYLILGNTLYQSIYQQ